jgi:hypothetical protein
MELTSKEFALAVAFFLLGLVLTARNWILFLSTLNPLEGLIVYDIILFGTLYVLSRLDLVVFGFKIKSVSQVIGLMLISTAFFMIVNWENPYCQFVTTGSFDGASQIFYESEDGVSWMVWSHFLPSANVEALRIFAFALTPFLLALIGGLLASEKIKLG